MTFTINGTQVASPDRTEDFGNGPAFNGVTNEFAASGLTVTTEGGTGIVLANIATCNNSASGVTDAYLYFGLDAPCSLSAAADGALLTFDSDVTALSWTGFFRDVGSSMTLEALLDGALVGSTILDSSDNFENRTVLVSGGTFDQVRFTEPSAGNVLLGFDNLRWNVAAAAVPVPATLPLLLGGVLGMAALSRRSRRRA